MISCPTAAFTIKSIRCLTTSGDIYLFPDNSCIVVVQRVRVQDLLHQVQIIQLFSTGRLLPVESFIFHDRQGCVAPQQHVLVEDLGP